MTFPLNTNDLLKFLHKMELTPELEPHSGQVFISKPFEGVDFALFFSPRDNALHLITYFPYQFEKVIAGDLGRLLHILNKQIDMPGFCMDEKEGLVFYRTVLPCIDGNVDINLLGMHMGAHKRVLEMCHRVIFAVASGKVKLEETNLL